MTLQPSPPPFSPHQQATIRAEIQRRRALEVHLEAERDTLQAQRDALKQPVSGVVSVAPRGTAGGLEVNLLEVLRNPEVTLSRVMMAKALVTRAVRSRCVVVASGGVRGWQ